MKYFEVGKKINYNGTILLVAKTKDNKPVCTGCYFSDGYRIYAGMPKISCCAHCLACTAGNRKDNHHVIFIQL